MGEELVPTGGPDPWERLEEETAQEYTAFTEYCKIGPSRSLRKLSTHMGISHDTVKIYSRKNQWVKRAKAMDLAASQLVPTDIDMSPTETMAFQFAVGKAMLDLGIRALALKKPGQIKTTDIIKLIDKGSELQRKAQGIDTPGVQVNINSKGFEAVKDLLDELEGFAVEEDDENESS